MLQVFEWELSGLLFKVWIDLFVGVGVFGGIGVLDDIFDFSLLLNFYKYIFY